MNISRAVQKVTKPPYLAPAQSLLQLRLPQQKLLSKLQQKAQPNTIDFEINNHY